MTCQMAEHQPAAQVKAEPEDISWTWIEVQGSAPGVE